MKDISCCTFHSLGGPDSMGCDDYRRAGDEGRRADAPDYDTEPEVHARDLDEWDAYSNAADEEASSAHDVAEAPVELLAA